MVKHLWKPSTSKWNKSNIHYLSLSNAVQRIVDLLQSMASDIEGDADRARQEIATRQ